VHAIEELCRLLCLGIHIHARTQQGLVEHHFPIKQVFMPHKQPAWSFNSEVVAKVKDEVEQLLKVGFIQPCRYAEWVSNIVLVEKKVTGKIRVCIDFRDLNRATPK
jgi:hypothetical protein